MQRPNSYQAGLNCFKSYEKALAELQFEEAQNLLSEAQQYFLAAAKDEESHLYAQYWLIKLITLSLHDKSLPAETLAALNHEAENRLYLIASNILNNADKLSDLNKDDKLLLFGLLCAQIFTAKEPKIKQEFHFAAYNLANSMKLKPYEIEMLLANELEKGSDPDIENPLHSLLYYFGAGLYGHFEGFQPLINYLANFPHLPLAKKISDALKDLGPLFGPGSELTHQQILNTIIPDLIALKKAVCGETFPTAPFEATLIQTFISCLVMQYENEGFDDNVAPLAMGLLNRARQSPKVYSMHVIEKLTEILGHKIFNSCFTTQIKAAEENDHSQTGEIAGLYAKAQQLRETAELLELEHICRQLKEKTKDNVQKYSTEFSFANLMLGIITYKEGLSENNRDKLVAAENFFRQSIDTGLISGKFFLIQILQRKLVKRRKKPDVVEKREITRHIISLADDIERAKPLYYLSYGSLYDLHSIFLKHYTETKQERFKKLAIELLLRAHAMNHRHTPTLLALIDYQKNNQPAKLSPLAQKRRDADTHMHYFLAVINGEAAAFEPWIEFHEKRKNRGIATLLTKLHQASQNKQTVTWPTLALWEELIASTQGLYDLPLIEQQTYKLEFIRALVTQPDHDVLDERMTKHAQQLIAAFENEEQGEYSKALLKECQGYLNAIHANRLVSAVETTNHALNSRKRKNKKKQKANTQSSDGVNIASKTEITPSQSMISKTALRQEKRRVTAELKAMTVEDQLAGELRKAEKKAVRQERKKLARLNRIKQAEEERLAAEQARQAAELKVKEEQQQRKVEKDAARKARKQLAREKRREHEAKLAAELKLEEENKREAAEEVRRAAEETRLAAEAKAQSEQAQLAAKLKANQEARLAEQKQRAAKKAERIKRKRLARSLRKEQTESIKHDPAIRIETAQGAREEAANTIEKACRVVDVEPKKESIVETELLVKPSQPALIYVGNIPVPRRVKEILDFLPDGAMWGGSRVRECLFYSLQEVEFENILGKVDSFSPCSDFDIFTSEPILENITTKGFVKNHNNPNLYENLTSNIQIIYHPEIKDDFTIIFFADQDGKTYCRHQDAIKHLLAREPHTVEDPKITFANDPKRIFRYLLLIAQGYKETYSIELMKEMYPYLSKLPPKVINSKLCKHFMRGEAHRNLTVLIKFGLYQTLFSGINEEQLNFLKKQMRQIDKKVSQKKEQHESDNSLRAKIFSYFIIARYKSDQATSGYFKLDENYLNNVMCDFNYPDDLCKIISLSGINFLLKEIHKENMTNSLNRNPHIMFYRSERAPIQQAPTPVSLSPEQSQFQPVANYDPAIISMGAAQPLWSPELYQAYSPTYEAPLQDGEWLPPQPGGFGRE